MEELFKGADRGACREYDTGMFVFDLSEDKTEEPVAIARAREVCATCCPDIRAECLAWALKHYEVGIWGGTSERERRIIRRDRKNKTVLPRL